MSRIDTNFVKQLYSQAGVELTPEKLDHISNNYSSNEELQSAFELKYGSMNMSTPEKKNSDVTSTSTSEAPQSESQQPPKKTKSLSVGGKPIRTGASASSAGNDKEKKSFEDTKVVYINKDPKRGEVDDMSKPLPPGYRYEVVQNSAQLRKWKEQKSKINNESPFGPPIQTFQEQKTQEFKEVKKKEEAKKKEELKSMPVLGKDAQLNVPKADAKTTDLSGVKKVEIKPLTKTDQVSKNQVVNVAYDYAVNNLDTSLSEEKYQDEINEKQFTDGIKQGLINIYNDVIGNPLSSVTNLDLVVKKSKPLEAQYKEIEKIEAKEGVSYSPEVKEKMAKDMFIEEENKKQMYTLIDKALPSGYDREGIWKDLKLQSIRSNDELRSIIASAEVFKGKINKFNDSFKENYKYLNKIEGGNEDKGNKYVLEIGGKKITLSESKYQEYEKLRQEAIDAKSKLESMSLDIDKIYNKASKDDELLDLFKYNYNDFQATKDRVLGGVGEIIGGGLKLLGEGGKYIEDKAGFAPGLALIPGVSDKAIKAGDALLDISQEERDQYLRYNASDLTWDNLPSFGLQLFSEQLPVFLSIGLAGPGGLAAVSAGSGGRQFRDLEIEEQNNPFVRYSQGQKLTSAFLYGGAEYAGEFFGTRVLLKGFGNTIRNASLQNRRLFYDGMIKSTIKSLPKVATGAGVEGGSELATATMQIGVDLGVLGKEVKSKEAFERLYEQGFSGAGMGFGMSVAANNLQLVAAQSKVFSSRQDMRKVGNLLNEIDALNKELNENPLLSEEDKAIIYKDMNAKTNEAFNIVSKNSAREKDFTTQEKAELLNINARQIELKEEYDKITDSNISEKIKKQKIDELNNKFNALEAKRNDILNKTYNEFNYLPESEKISLKTQAAEAIIQEQLDKGVERDNIQEPNAEVINKKAIEIYESNKQTTGQVSEQEKPTTDTETKTTDATQQETELQSQEKISTTPKTETDAVQKQITDEGVLQPEQSKMGLQEMEQRDTKQEVVAKQGEEIFSEIEGKDLSDKTTYDKVYDFLTKIENDLTDIQDNTLTAQGLPISVVKTAIKAMKAAMVAGKMASEVISAGIDALKNTDWYNKKTDVEKANLEPSLANIVIESSVRDEGKSMAKAEEKKQMALTEKIAERAKTNVVKARLGKLSKNGIFRGRVSKVLSLSTIRPKDAKKILPKDLYDKYVSSIIKLAERGLTIKDTNIPNYEAVYDEIIPYFEEFEDKKATIQEKIYNGEDLTVEEQAFFDKNKKEFFESESKRDESKNEEKEKEIAKNKQELKDLRSKLRDAFKKSNLEKGSKTFEYIDAASMLTDEQIDSMSNAMLKNAIKAFNSFINDGVAPGYFSQIYANSRTSKVESGISEIDKTAEKTGIYKYKIPKFIADVAQSIESFMLNLRKLDSKEKMVARIEKYRGTQIDAALKIYRGTPIYDNVIAPIAEKLSLFSSDTEKSLEEMNLVYKSFLKSLKMSDDIFTSMLRIRYAQIYNMQKKNKGTKSGKVLAIDYLKETLKANIYSESENKKISDFIDYLESKGEDYDISNELTKAEQNAINGIRVPLDLNTESAYEERVFGNSNASPMIVDYVPVSGKDQMSDADINDLVKRFEKGSFVSGNLKEKTGKAHPIDLNPFSSAMSSIMSSKLQYHLRTEVLAIKRGINNALNEAKESGNKQKVKLLSAVSEAIDSYVDAIVVGNKIKATAMDKTIDNIATVVSTALLASETRAAAEFITNTPVLLADGLPMLLEGRKIVSDINELSNGNPDALRDFLKTIGASQITSLMDKMKSASEKAGYTKKGVFANVMSSEIPTSVVKEKAKRFATDNKISNALGIYRNFLISGSDNMSRFTYFFGKFADEFKKEYGSPIEVDKVLDKNSDYLKDEKVLAAIKKASLTTNRETTELFGSNNPMERALVSLQASKGMKGKNPITKMLDYVGNYMNQFNRGVVSAMRKNINVAIEEKNGRELRKFLLQALRTMGYAPATVAISNLIGYAFYSDDDDEEQLKESLGKLREDEDLIKEVNGYFDFVKNKQEGDEYTKEEEKYRKDLMEKLMKNPEFKKAYDANYSFFNNKLLTQRISALTEKMNEGKSNFGLDSFERMIKIIDGDKETYGGSVEDFVKSMAYLNSERGMSYYSKEKRLELMEKIEDYFAENNFFDKRSVREREGVLDIQAGYDLLEKLYNYREKGLDDRLLEEGVKMGLNYTIGAKGNLVRSSYETGAEYINRKMIEKKFDHYDYKKDKMFDRPITKFGLDDKAKLSDIPKDLGRAITPAYIQYPTSMKESDIAIAKTLGLPLASSLNRAYNQKQKDEIYKETRGKFQENMLENINETALSAEAIRYILDKLEISMTEEEKEEVINIALTPGKGGDKGKTENKGRSSDRLKVGNKKLRGE